MAKTIIAIYKDIVTAERAIHELVKSGIARHDISLVANGAEGLSASQIDTRISEQNVAETIDQGGALVVAWVMDAWADKAIRAINNHGPLYFKALAASRRRVAAWQR